MKGKKIIAAAGLLCLSCALLGAYGASHVRLDGKFVPKNAVSLSCSGDIDRALPTLEKMRDLRELDLGDRALTAHAYAALREALPECDLRWNVTVQGEVYSSRTRSVVLSGLTRPEAELLAALPELSAVDGEGCSGAADLEALALLARARPDVAVAYHYTLAGQSISSEDTAVSLENVSGAALETALGCLPGLRQVRLSGELPDPAFLSALQARYPETVLDWTAAICGRPCSRDTRVLDLSGADVTAGDLDRISAYLPRLERLELGETALPWETIKAFLAARPDVDCRYAVTLCGKTFPNDAEEVDLSGCPVDDLPRLEAALEAFPKLKKVILSDCGQSSEALDALDRRLPDIRVVWTVKLGKLRVRTDDTWFMPVKFHEEVTDRDLEELKYCHDMICIDVGHMKITSCDWAAEMPELQYLVLADTQVSDISALANHEKLVFLELFLTRVTDLTPLESCRALDDLNLCYLTADARPISHMPWLKRLWWTQNGRMAQKLPEDCRAERILPEALPNTEIKFHSGDSVGSGWRKGAHYYEMRDILGMFYIDSK